MGAGYEQAEGVGSGMSALIVEPSGFYAAHMEQILVANHCQCDKVKTTAEAKAALRRTDYGLVCISRQLGDGNGPELAKFIRDEPGMARVPLVMVTAEQDQQAFEEAYAAGFTEVFFRGELQRLSDYLAFIATTRKEDRRLVGRVLYLEDTKWLAAVTIGILHNLGLAVDHFTSVPPALESFEKVDYDIVITDIVLEGTQSGVYLVQAIRAMQDARASMPILAVTGLEDDARRIELFRAGVSDYIAKPVITEELVARVSNLIINKQLLETVQAQQEKLTKMASLDALTGLYNRRRLHCLASAAIAVAKACATPMSVVLLDIDHFKRFNDQYGHQVGDRVLVGVGEILLKAAADVEAVAARLGGEEFLVLLEGMNLVQATAYGEALREQIQQDRPGDHDVSVSIGVAEFTADDTYDRLFENADRALYQAKEGGRNQVCVATSIAS